MKVSARNAARVGAGAVGALAGLVLFPLAAAGMFVLRNDDLPEGVLALATPALLAPLAIFAAVSPAAGGRVIVCASAASAAAFSWSLIGNRDATIGDAAAMLALYAGIAALGGIFWWAGAAEGPERPNEEGRVPRKDMT